MLLKCNVITINPIAHSHNSIHPEIQSVISKTIFIDRKSIKSFN